MNSSSLFGARLRIERERLNLSQAAAGAVAGVSREMWGKYERGAMPGSEVLLRLAESDFDMTYLFTNQRSGGTPPAPALKPDEAALLDNYRHCSPEGKRGVAATVSALAKCKHDEDAA